MPHRHLPQNANLRHLRDQARDLLRGYRRSDPVAVQRVREFHPKPGSEFRLSDAQLTIAREYAFESWPKLKAAIESGSVPDDSIPFVDRIPDPLFREAVRRIDSGDAEGLRQLLAERPSLARQRVYFSASDYFGRPGLLQFVAQNPIRQKTMPNALEVAEVLLDAGAPTDETLLLVATGRVPREQGVQIPLIDLLCERGASIRDLTGVLAHGEFEAAAALLRYGAARTLAVCAAFGWTSEFESLLPSATPDERHLALALAAQFGRVPILERLLALGEDPNRYNPPGAHAHSTPLHQAVVHNHPEAVAALLRSGARVDIRDTLFGGTAADWAEHAHLPGILSCAE